MTSRSSPISVTTSTADSCSRICASHASRSSPGPPVAPRPHWRGWPRTVRRTTTSVCGGPPTSPWSKTAPRSILHFGSIAAFLQPGATVVDRLIDRIASPTDAWPEAALLTFDPNIRPSIIGSHDAVLPRFEQLASRVDLVKLSDADADWLYPDLDAHAQIDRVLDLGADLVAMTRGGNGAIVATASARAEVGAVQVEVRDTIGAGDTFMVSLIHELHTSRTSLDSLREAELTRLGERAAGLAAITVGREGADLPWSEDLTR
jgi:fructokinase